MKTAFTRSFDLSEARAIRHFMLIGVFLAPIAVSPTASGQAIRGEAEEVPQSQSGGRLASDNERPPSLVRAQPCLQDAAVEVVPADGPGGPRSPRDGGGTPRSTVLYANSSGEQLILTGSTPRTSGADEALFDGPGAIITSMQLGYSVDDPSLVAFDARIRFWDDLIVSAAGADPQFSNLVGELTIPFINQTVGEFFSLPIDLTGLAGGGVYVTANPATLGVPDITDVYIQIDFLQAGTTTPVSSDGVTYLFDGSGVDTGYTFSSPVLGGSGGSDDEFYWRDVNLDFVIGADEKRLFSFNRANFWLLLEGSVRAPALLTYQGRLSQSGAPVNGLTDFEFRFYSTDEGGTALGSTITRLGVDVSEGLFTVELDPVPELLADEPRWLEIAVAHPPGGPFTVLSPRQRLTASPYCISSTYGQWEGLRNVPSGFSDGVDDVGPWNVSGSDINYLTGNVGIGMTTPTDPLAVNGIIRSITGGFKLPDGTVIDSASDLGSGDITGVTAGSGLTGGGASGQVTLSANFAGSGAATTIARSDHYHNTLAASDGSPGNAVAVDSAGKVGVGTSTPDTTLHVATGSDATLANGTGYQVIGLTAGVNLVLDNNEIMARNSGAASSLYLNGEGGDVVVGDSEGYSTLHVEGVTGYSPFRVRVVNSTKILAGDNGSLSVGSGTVGPANGLRVAGDCNVIGTLTKGGGSFKIDHPLDPDNRYLYHSFVESPDMMNIYNGNITTDEQGYAVVTLPDWFEALNRDFRYQLTVIGSFARAMVAEEVHDGAFVIRTEEPNVKVSWQVTGIRQDAWAQQNRIPVEVEKEAENRGRYLHPEAFGLSPDWNVSATPEPDAAERRAASGHP